ncbi:hypothetical protein Tco_0236587 [Tanacetum coccineum]
MADLNIPANDASVEQAPAIAPPTRTDDQIFPLSNCQLDEQWFNLHKDLLRDSLDITPTNNNNPFVAPPSSDTVIEYVNTLGYPVKLLDMTGSGKTGSRDRPPMLATGRYAQWRSQFLRYINTRPNGDTLRKCILKDSSEMWEAIEKATTSDPEEAQKDKDMQKNWLSLQRYFKELY